MKELSEYITEYVSSGRGKKPSFPEDLKDIKNVIEFLEINGFSDATKRTDTESMPEILSTFKKSNEPVYIYNEYYKYSYWLRFYYTEKPTRNITEENPIFTVSFNPSYHSSDPDTYFIEKTVGDTIKQINRDKFMELLKSHFGWS